MENQIDIILKAFDEASGTIKKVSAELEVMTRKAAASTKTTTAGNAASGTSFMSLGRSILFSAAALTAFKTAKGILTLTSQVEQAKISFVTLLGSQEKALAMMKDIDTFAAKTPFEKTTLTPIVQQIIGMGFAAETALPVINVLGDSMAALWRGQEDLQGVVLAMGQIQTKGHLVQQELNQMAERGLPVFSILEEKLHLTKDQMGDIGKAGISSSVAINALLVGLNEKFAGAMLRQNNTLRGQWSNLMDNVKSMVGNTGQALNSTVTGWIKTINGFFDANRPVIVKFTGDMLFFITNMLISVGQAFSFFGTFFGDLMAGLTQDTENNVTSQANSWGALMMYVSNAFIGAVSTIKFFIQGVVDMIYLAGTIIADVLIGVGGAIVAALGTFLFPVQQLINVVIEGINRFSDVFGTKMIQKVSFATTMMTQGVNAVKYSVTGGAQEIGVAWEKMGNHVAGTFVDATTLMKANVDKFKEGVKPDTSKSDIFDRIAKSLKDMEEQLKKTTAATWSSKDATKAANAELKKMKEMAEDSMKAVTDKIKYEQKEITETRKKITELASEWTKYKAEAVLAISTVNNELAKLKKEASDITIKSNSDRDTAMAERLVDVYKEIEDHKKNISESQNDNGDGQKTNDIIKMQAELVKLEEERDYIKGHVTESIIAERQAYADLSQAQKIGFDAEKERANLLAENETKQAALIEKRMILEKQATQTGIQEMGIMIGEKDGMLTASILDASGKRVEIQDTENIALANDIATKQQQYKADADMLTQTLSTKLAAERSHINQVADMYATFNAYLKKDTAETAAEMIATMGQVTSQLEKVISLRQKAWFGSMQAGVVLDGAKADGGPVEANGTYLVGERGPELFRPGRSGTIIPNESMGGVNVTIQMGGVVVKGGSAEDARQFVRQVKEELTRELQTFKLGVV